MRFSKASAIPIMEPNKSHVLGEFVVRLKCTIVPRRGLLPNRIDDRPSAAHLLDFRVLSLSLGHTFGFQLLDGSVQTDEDAPSGQERRGGDRH